MTHLAYKNFYQTASGLIGLVLTDNTFGTERQSFAVRYEDGYLLDNYSNLAYSWLETNNLVEIKKRTLLTGPLKTKIIVENNTKYVYFPTLRRKLNYSEICCEYALDTKNREDLIQFCPHGYDYSYFLSHDVSFTGSNYLHYGNSFQSSSQDIDFINWVNENFSNLDFHISSYFISRVRYMPTKHSEKAGFQAEQLGHEVHFKNQEQVNLTKLVWKNLKLMDLRNVTYHRSIL